MPQFKECTVDELLRDSLIDFSLKHNNKTMFDLLTGEDWKDHIMKEDYQEECNEEELYIEEIKQNIERIKQNMEQTTKNYILVKKILNNINHQKHLINECYEIFGVDWRKEKSDFCCDLHSVSDVLSKIKEADNEID
jgi:hypothetical protein